MSTIPITVRPGASNTDLADLERRLEDVGTLHHLLAASGPDDAPFQIEEILAQDEYTHDVLVPWSGGRWLVFDST